MLQSDRAQCRRIPTQTNQQKLKRSRKWDALDDLQRMMDHIISGRCGGKSNHDLSRLPLFLTIEWNARTIIARESFFDEICQKPKRNHGRQLRIDNLLKQRKWKNGTRHKNGSKTSGFAIACENDDASFSGEFLGKNVVVRTISLPFHFSSHSRDLMLQSRYLSFRVILF